MEITCALAQIDPTTGDIEGNTALILDELDRATAAGLDLVAFPELAITGYCIMDLVEDDSFVEANRRALERVRENTRETAAVVGFIDREGGKKYNAAAVLHRGEIVGVARKVLLPNYRYFDDPRYFESGGPVSPIPVDVRGQTVDLGVVVCEDMWDDPYTRQPIPELASEGADLILSVNASPFFSGKRRTRHETIQRHIADTGLGFLYVNTVGAADVGQNVVVFDGDSLAYAPDGTLLARGEQFASDRVTVTVDTTSRHLDERRHDIRMERRETELYDALVTALRDYASKTGFEEAVLPLSGDLGSALGLAIAADALGSENVTALACPVDENRETRARQLAENVGVEYHALPIQSIHDEITATYEAHVGPIASEEARGAVAGRLRGLLAMLTAEDAAAGDRTMLVSTGSETEMALGHVTLYGDMAGHLGLLGDLSTGDVHALVEHVNERYGAEVIPAEAMDGRNTAVSGADGIDPVDYRTMEAIVDHLLEGRMSPAEIVTRFESGRLAPDQYRRDVNGRSMYDRYDVDAFASLVYETYRRMRDSTYKRTQTPPIVAVSKRAFGEDFREPVINHWDGRMPERDAQIHQDAHPR